MSQLKVKDGNNWINIPASGMGIPSGGTTGQVLQKSSNTDYATEWVDNVLYFTDVAVSATTGDIVSLIDARITADHVVTSCVFANLNSIASNINWITATGSLTLSGTCTSATTANIVLVLKTN